MPDAYTPHEAALMSALGRSVRTRRLERGLSRAALAERAALSSRYLADVEAGRANISVVKLDRVALALDTTAAALLQSDGVTPVVLLGLRGSGKSTVGAALAARRGVPFLELDQLVEQRAGLPLAEVFAVHGEDFYRRMERNSVEAFLADGEQAVVAAGGGLVTHRDTFEAVKRSCVTVWLRAKAEEHMDRVVAQGDARPMAQRSDAMAELRQLLTAREPLYAEAEITVDTSGRTPDEVLELVADAL